MKSFAWALAVGLAVLASSADAALLRVHIPGIAGGASTPGYPGAIALRSLTVAPNQFSIVKDIDSTSLPLQQAVVLGTPLSATALAYDSAPAGTPDVALSFPTALGSSYQVVGLTDEVAFSTTRPGSIFLEVPGIVGASSTPGHPGVIALESFTLSPGEFSVLKLVDSASTALAQAVASGTNYPAARVLFYHSAAPGAVPDDVIAFAGVLGSSYQLLGGGATAPLERVSFAYAHVPEPSGCAMGACAALIGLVRRRGPGLVG